MVANLSSLLPSLTTVPYVGSHAITPAGGDCPQPKLLLPVRKLLGRHAMLPRTCPVLMEQASSLLAAIKAPSHQAAMSCQGYQAMEKRENWRHQAAASNN